MLLKVCLIKLTVSHETGSRRELVGEEGTSRSEGGAREGNGGEYEKNTFHTCMKNHSGTHSVCNTH